MTENFIFKALFISLAAHTAVLCVTYWGKVNDPHYKAIRQNRIEISYKPTYRRVADIREYPIRPAQHLDLSNSPQFFSDGSVPVSLVKEKPALPFGMLFERKPEHMRTMELSHRVSISPIRSEKINNPVYAAYNEIVHNRVLEKANQVYDKKFYQNSNNKETGTVYLTFLINEYGALTSAQIIPEKTNASERLQEIAMESLRESSPFPVFLKGMSLSEYSLNIEIEYQDGD